MSTTTESSKGINRVLLTIVVLLGVVAIWIAVRVIAPDTPTIFAGTQPDNLGVNDQTLISCPSSPNCVSSQSSDPEHYIEPITFEGSTTEAIAALKQIIENQDRTKIVAETDDYFYAQFTSRWMGFVDDVEFFVDQPKGVIDVRSASRLGESDLGVNRQRIEQIRQAFNS